MFNFKHALLDYFQKNIENCKKIIYYMQVGNKINIDLYRNKEKLILNQNVDGEIQSNNYNIFYKI